jgi:hypothetical protein
MTPSDLKRLTPQDFVMLATAWLVVARARLALWLLPWPRLMKAASPRRSTSMPPPSVERLAWAVRAASRFIPRATCLAQALALNQWLHRQGLDSNVQIGVTTGDGHFAAHAWVEHNGRPLLSSAREIERYARCLTVPRAHADSMP